MTGKRIGRIVERAGSYCVVSALVLVFGCAPMTAQMADGAAQAAAMSEHGGQHDFDFALGTWKVISKAGGLGSPL